MDAAGALGSYKQGFNDNYFTMPGTTPRNHELPDNYEKWADVFGRGVIKEFNEQNINFATRESFDFFYPGYGSSYPSTIGAIGMLAEQGGHSRGGTLVATEDAAEFVTKDASGFTSIELVKKADSEDEASE